MVGRRDDWARQGRAVRPEGRGQFGRERSGGGREGYVVAEAFELGGEEWWMANENHSEKGLGGGEEGRSIRACANHPRPLVPFHSGLGTGRPEHPGVDVKATLGRYLARPARYL